MSAPIEVLLDRTLELSALLVKLCQAESTQEFWRLQKQFDELVDVFKLEDELNATSI